MSLINKDLSEKACEIAEELIKDLNPSQALVVLKIVTILINEYKEV